jgi:hypothetical protein
MVLTVDTLLAALRARCTCAHRLHIHDAERLDTTEAPQRPARRCVRLTFLRGRPPLLSPIKWNEAEVRDILIIFLKRA